MQTYLVGGAVRDQLLGLPIEERDWVVVGGTPEMLIKQGFKPVGKDFPVFIHPQTGEEYALARTERKTAPGYKGFTFHADKNVTLIQDLYRRDLTINAMARDDHGQIIDPFGGQADIKNRLFRHVSDAFQEDPVRILRVARLAAHFHHLGFSVAESTMKLMQSMVQSGETEHLVSERVWQECHKALSEKTPVVFFQVLADCGAIHHIFPTLVDHLEIALDNLQQLSTLSRSPEKRFSALCLALDTDSIKKLCQQLTVPNNYRDLALLVRRQCEVIQKGPRQTVKNIVENLKRSDSRRKPERFLQAVNVCLTLSKASNLGDAEIFWQRALSEYQRVDVQNLIQQGLEKSALGEALVRQRIENIERLVKHCQ